MIDTACSAADECVASYVDQSRFLGTYPPTPALALTLNPRPNLVGLSPETWIGLLKSAMGRGPQLNGNQCSQSGGASLIIEAPLVFLEYWLSG